MQKTNYLINAIDLFPLPFGAIWARAAILIFSIAGLFFWAFVYTLDSNVHLLIDSRFIIDFNLKLFGIVILSATFSSAIVYSLNVLTLWLPLHIYRRSILRRLKRNVSKRAPLIQIFLTLFFIATTLAQPRDVVILTTFYLGIFFLAKLTPVNVNEGRVEKTDFGSSEEKLAHLKKSVSQLNRSLKRNEQILGFLTLLLVISLTITIASAHARNVKNGPAAIVSVGDSSYNGSIVGKTFDGIILFDNDCSCVTLLPFSSMTSVYFVRDNPT